MVSNPEYDVMKVIYDLILNFLICDKSAALYIPDLGTIPYKLPDFLFSNHFFN